MGFRMLLKLPVLSQPHQLFPVQRSAGDAPKSNIKELKVVRRKIYKRLCIYLLQKLNMIFRFILRNSFYE